MQISVILAKAAFIVIIIGILTTSFVGSDERLAAPLLGQLGPLLVAMGAGIDPPGQVRGKPRTELPGQDGGQDRPAGLGQGPAEGQEAGDFGRGEKFQGHGTHVEEPVVVGGAEALLLLLLLISLFCCCLRRWRLTGRIRAWRRRIFGEGCGDGAGRPSGRRRTWAGAGDGGSRLRVDKLTHGWRALLSVTLTHGWL